MSRRGVLGTLLLALGCGEVETLELTVRPRLDDFEAEVQPLLIQLGCSGNGRCHAVVQGDYQLIVDPDPADVQTNYLSATGKIDLESPDESPLLALLVQGAEPAHPPPPRFCFVDTESCAYQKIRAWIAWDGPSDPRPQDIDCDASEATCE